MSIHGIKTLSTSQATRLSPAGTHSGTDITIQNLHHEAYVYIGGPTVTSSDYGFRLTPGSAISFELPPKDSIYAVTDTNSSTVAVFMTGLE